MENKVRPELDEEKLAYILSFTGETVISKSIHRLALYCKGQIEKGVYLKDLERMDANPPKKIKLYVKKANKSDVGKNVIRLDKTNRDLLGIRENTIVEIVTLKETD
jgi:hypothetical protein